MSHNSSKNYSQNDNLDNSVNSSINDNFKLQSYEQSILPDNPYQSIPIKYTYVFPSSPLQSNISKSSSSKFSPSKSSPNKKGKKPIQTSKQSPIITPSIPSSSISSPSIPSSSTDPYIYDYNPNQNNLNKNNPYLSPITYKDEIHKITQNVTVHDSQSVQQVSKFVQLEQMLERVRIISLDITLRIKQLIQYKNDNPLLTPTELNVINLHINDLVIIVNSILIK